MSTESYEATPRLRFVERLPPPEYVEVGLTNKHRILQQWFAPPMPSYMRDPKVGEWRDIPLETGES